jgi:hypothetical protein
LPSVLPIRNDTLQPLLRSAFEHRLGAGLEILSDANPRGLNFSAVFRMRRRSISGSCVRFWYTERSKNEVADALRLASGMLKKIEIRMARIIEHDELLPTCMRLAILNNSTRHCF